MTDVKPQVTVALSVYNIDLFLRQTLDSVLRQTFKDFELLCIDDASTDKTYDILQEYAVRDSRIRIIRHKKNQGLSVSRNRAIQEARGEYLIMIDGDDLFAPEMIEEAMEESNRNDADIVLWDYQTFSKNSELEGYTQEKSSLGEINRYDKRKLLRLPSFMSTRLLKTAELRRMRIHFPEGMTKQDIPVHWKLITSTDRITLIPKKFLYYRQQPFSTTNRKDRSVFSLAYVMDIVKQQLVEDGIYNKYKNEFLRSRLSLLQGMYDVVQKQLKEDALSLVKERLGDDELLFLEDPNNQLTKRVRSFYGMIQGDTWSTISYKGTLLMRDIYRIIKRI